MSEKEDLVEITTNEYEQLRIANTLLACLYAAGVANWEGYDEAMEMRDGLYV